MILELLSCSLSSICDHNELSSLKNSQFALLYEYKRSLARIGSSHRGCSVRKGVPGNFAKFIGKHLCQSLFFNKVAGLRPATVLKKRLWHRRFPVNFAKFIKTPFLQNTSGRLLLQDPSEYLLRW